MDPLRRQPTDARAEKLLDVAVALGELDREFPIQLLQTLLYVASHKDCHTHALEEGLSCSTARGSRHTVWLFKEHRLGKEGLGLITKEKDPSNRRRLQLSLTVEGQCLIDTLKGILYD